MSTPDESCILNHLQEIKEHYLNMSLEEKRKLYACKGNYVRIDQIQRWKTSALIQDLEHSHSFDTPYERNDTLNSILSLYKGDITQLEVDCIVNAAKNSLKGGGGVDGAIHEAAGAFLLEECLRLNGCKTGQAKMTAGYNLPARFVMHTVGPYGENPVLLKDAYENSLKCAVQNGCRTIAFPCISTGIYGYPNEKAAHVVLKTVREFLEIDDNYENFDLIVFCFFLRNDMEIYKQLMSFYFPKDSTRKVVENEQKIEREMPNVDTEEKSV